MAYISILYPTYGSVHIPYRSEFGLRSLLNPILDFSMTFNFFSEEFESWPSVPIESMFDKMFYDERVVVKC